MAKKRKVQPTRRIRATYSLDANVVSDLQSAVAELKRAARLEGVVLPSMSEVVERAIKAELARMRKRG